MKILKLLLVLFLVQTSLNALAKDFYVSPKGNDSNIGSKEQPFATILKAKEKVREWNQTNGSEDITIWLSSGDYRLKETLVFSLEDGAKPGQVISYSALPGETPIISSDVPLTGWKKLKGMPKGFSKSAKGKIWVAQLSDNTKPFHTLYNSQQMLSRARTIGLPHLRSNEPADDRLLSKLGRDSLYNTLPFDKEIMKERQDAPELIPSATAIGYAASPLYILDLFCKAGGASMGLHLAFPNAKITGVDIEEQKHYPFSIKPGLAEEL